ncbi:hypothetical protein SKB0092_42130 (plasmid) [Roseomonas mucosa]
MPGIPAPSPAAADRSPPTEALAGLVERVTYHNAENGFCVLRVKARGHRDLVTVVGHAASISAGEWVQMSGAWVNDRVHGPQFRAGFLKATQPTTREGIEKYLGSGMIRGIEPTAMIRVLPGISFALTDTIDERHCGRRSKPPSPLEFDASEVVANMPEGELCVLRAGPPR